jgi:hypothetical protein
MGEGQKNEVVEEATGVKTGKGGRKDKKEL